jgi:hypothetical protein
METISLAQDIEGRISNINWKPSTQWAIPILEAVSNSLHATIHIRPQDRNIRITLIREGDDQKSLVTDKQRERPIVGFRVEDNGVGFDDDNFEAFKTLDTRHKKEIGGKGIGRLFWLKAFSLVSIESLFRQNGKAIKRSITFRVGGVTHNTEEIKDIHTQSLTFVEVKGIKPEYKRFYNKLATTVAKEIADEFLPYFILNGWPGSFCVSFTDSGDGIVNVREIMDYSCSDTVFDIGRHNFKCYHVRNHQNDKHKVFFCAADRVVSGYKTDIASFLPKKQLESLPGKKFSYLGLVTSQYLTDNVSTERDGFLIPETSRDQYYCGPDRDISLEDIAGRVKQEISQNLKESLVDAQKDTLESVARVLSENPELKVVLFTSDDVQPLISYTDTEIKRTFRQKLYEQLENSKSEIDSLIARLGTDNPIDLNEFKKEFDAEVKRFSLLNQSHVVSYILYRRHVLSLLEKALMLTPDMSVVKEKFIHNLIFPMGEQGEPAKFGGNHNLWLIDDRLSMVEWIASDVAINKHGLLCDCSSTKEPDLVFYNLAYSENVSHMSDAGYSEIHIVEFKRPVTFSNDPVRQILRYIYDIKNAKVKHIVCDGGEYKETIRTVRVATNTMFYGYVVFDLNEVRGSEKWERLVLENRLRPFMNGYLYYDDGIVIFINSFENIYQIAKKRNEAFFSKLTSSLGDGFNAADKH